MGRPSPVAEAEQDVELYTSPWVSGTRAAAYFGPISSELFLPDAEVTDRSAAWSKAERELLESELTGPTDLHVDGSRNVLELAGVFSGAHPITKSGGGTLRLASDNHAFTQPIQVDNGTLELAGPLGSTVNLADTGKLSGHGWVGPITGSGSVFLRQSILYADSVAIQNYWFVFGKTGSPLYDQIAAAGNGFLILPSAPIAPQTLDIFLGAVPATGDVYRGGYFVPFNVNLLAELAGTA